MYVEHFSACSVSTSARMAALHSHCSFEKPPAFAIHDGSFLSFHGTAERAPIHFFWQKRGRSSKQSCWSTALCDSISLTISCRLVLVKLEMLLLRRRLN